MVTRSTARSSTNCATRTTREKPSIKALPTVATAATDATLRSAAETQLQGFVGAALSTVVDGTEVL
jgi:hypothetical protein